MAGTTPTTTTAHLIDAAVTLVDHCILRYLQKLRKHGETTMFLGKSGTNSGGERQGHHWWLRTAPLLLLLLLLECSTAAAMATTTGQPFKPSHLHNPEEDEYEVSSKWSAASSHHSSHA